MECLVRIQETSTGNDQPDHEPNSDYGHCHGVEVTLEPALDEALPFDRIDFARARRKFPRRLKFIAGRYYLAHSRLKFRNIFMGGTMSELNIDGRSVTHKC